MHAYIDTVCHNNIIVLLPKPNNLDHWQKFRHEETQNQFGVSSRLGGEPFLVFHVTKNNSGGIRVDLAMVVVDCVSHV